MIKKVQFNKEFKNDKLSIFENYSVSTYPVVDIFGDSIEYEEGVLKLADASQYHDLKSGGVHYVFNLDLPAKVEANNLKLLRRSSALKNIFQFDKNKKFDLVGFMPWIIIVLLVLFHK
jgi:hypothetical protein